MINDKYKNQVSQLFENPGRIFGLLYPYLFVIFLGIGLYYLSNIGNVAQQRVPPVLSETPEVTDLTIQQPATIPPVDVNIISKPTSELIGKGKELYKTTCASCHGEGGAGAGPASIGLNPAPRNFTKHEAWINGETVSGIYTTLQEGIPNGSMIAYDFLTPEEKFSLAHYIRSEFISDPPLDSETDLQTLDLLYTLSAGVEIPGQIPTESAILIILEENSLRKLKVDDAIAQVENEDNTITIELLNSVTDDLRLAFSALENSDKWRTSEISFVNFLTANVNQNGFNGSIFNLSADEWGILYDYLNSIL
jgi:mono/diheme cytochrome c family protein